MSNEKSIITHRSFNELCILSGLLQNDSSGLITGLDDEQSKGKDKIVKTDVFRRYVSSISMSTMIKDCDNNTIKRLLYEIGVKDTNYKTLLACVGDPSLRWTQQIKLNDMVSQSLVNLHKKYSNFTGLYDFCDLSAIGFHLAKCIAVFNSFGVMSSEIARCGKDINVRALGVASEPITASRSSVFIPREVSRVMAPATFSALMCAANACGATVYTDVIQMDGNNSAIVQDFEGVEFIDGCYNGMRILMSMYNASQDGPTMAYAITKGLHMINTVVAHTDEGGYIRDVLRRGEFAVPFGGIFTDYIDTYVGIPAVSMQSKSQICASVDAMLLSTAAAVAVCDPCTIIRDRVYPRVYCSEDATRESIHAKQIAADCSDFCKNYITVIGKIFDVTGNFTVPLNHLVNSFVTSAKSIKNRHLNFDVIAPYYWIEPTTILQQQFNTIAETSGYSSLCNTRGDTIVDAFHKPRIESTLGNKFLMTYEHRTARTTPFLFYHQNHPNDGLAFVKPLNFVEDRMLLKGGVLGPAHARDAGHDIGRYMWTRGQSSIPAPSELTYIGERFGVVVTEYNLDDNLNIQNSTVYSCHEITNAKIKINCTVPSRIKNGKLIDVPRGAQRERCVAARALNNARQLVRIPGYSGGENFVASNTEIPYVSVGNESDKQTHVIAGEVIFEQSIGSKAQKSAPTEKIVHDQPLRNRVTQAPTNVNRGTGSSTAQNLIPPTQQQVENIENNENEGDNNDQFNSNEGVPGQ